MPRTVIALVLLGALPACRANKPYCEAHDFTEQDCWDTREEPQDTGPFLPLDPVIDVISCTYDPSAWTYTVELDGWAGKVTVDVIRPDEGRTIQETHTLDDIDYARDGTWDIWSRTVFVVADPSDQMDSISTSFPGTESMAVTLTWMATTWDRSLERLVDCTVWGNDLSLFDAYGCRPWGSP